MNLKTHFISFRKWHNGRYAEIDIEVVVRSDVKRDEAVRIAEEEIDALLEGQRARAARQTDAVPSYRFCGVV